MVHKNKPPIHQTIFGQIPKLPAVLKELIESNPLQRLKNIHQYGVSFYSNTQYPYSRYEHSLGVLHLLIKAQAPLKEQIAGLLHDVSHTVFSHVADMLFERKDSSPSHSYQDTIHEWYINQTEIPTILARHGLTVPDIMHKNKFFKALEQELPNLCADRLEYILHGSLLEQKISSQDLMEIVNSLHFDGQRWYFSDLVAAQHLALQALFLTEHIFTAAWNISGYYWAARALQRALKNEIISVHDIHFSHDSLVWNTLCSSPDPEIKELLNKIYNSRTCYQHASKDTCDIALKPKFRGVDPYILKDDKFFLLSTVDHSFAQQFSSLKNKLATGMYLKL